MNTTASNRQTKNSIIVGIVIILVIVGGWFFYQHHSSNLSGGGNSNPKISIDFPNIQAGKFSVALNSDLYMEGPEEKTFTKSVQPGTYQIIVSAPNYWPWTTSLALSKGDQTTLKPFLIQKNLPSTVYKAFQDSDYQDIDQLITAAAKKRSAVTADDTVSINFPKNSIVATWGGQGAAPDSFCPMTTAGTSTDSSGTTSALIAGTTSTSASTGSSTSAKPCPTTKTVITTKTPILDAGFYDNRNDVIIFGVSSGIYAIELTSHAPQNIQPIYEGNIQSMAIKGNEIYLHDQGAKGVIVGITLPDTSQNTSQK
ncbi:MAG TPA: hypothetical protein VFM02_00235 [Candidatus Paceibacterota bacterium]|nr:hypothetical protein [Candidatus Paceibacterota bacterium]